MMAPMARGKDPARLGVVSAMTKKSSMPDRRSALAGERFIYASSSLAVFGEVTVHPKSPGSNGQWVCLSCGQPLDNNLTKDIHCDTRPHAKARCCLTHALGTPAWHVLGWRSFESGNVEEP